MNGKHWDVLFGSFAKKQKEQQRSEDDERALIAREIDGHYDAFVEHVAKARKRPVSEIEPLARGHVYVGSDALPIGLVDHLGGFDRALELVRGALPGVTLAKDPQVIVGALPSRRAERATEKRALALLAELVPEPMRAAIAPIFAVLAEPHARVVALSFVEGVGSRPG